MNHFVYAAQCQVCTDPAVNTIKKDEKLYVFCAAHTQSAINGMGWYEKGVDAGKDILVEIRNLIPTDEAKDEFIRGLIETVEQGA